MKLEYYGHACFALRFDGGPTLVIDPFDASVTYAPCTAECDGALLSHDHFDHNHHETLTGDYQIIREAGSYEIGGAKITAIEAFHDPEQGALRGKTLLFRIEKDGLVFAHLGDLGHMPNEAQRAFLQGVDVMLVPAGGFYTIDTPQAEAVIRDLKPQRAIGMHFSTEAYSGAMSTDEAFVADMNAARMPKEIEITRESIASLPEVMVLAYK